MTKVAEEIAELRKSIQELISASHDLFHVLSQIWGTPSHVNIETRGIDVEAPLREFRYSFNAVEKRLQAMSPTLRKLLGDGEAATHQVDMWSAQLVEMRKYLRSKRRHVTEITRVADAVGLVADKGLPAWSQPVEVLGQAVKVLGELQQRKDLHPPDNHRDRLKRPTNPTLLELWELLYENFRAPPLPRPKRINPKRPPRRRPSDKKVAREYDKKRGENLLFQLKMQRLRKKISDWRNKPRRAKR